MSPDSLTKLARFKQPAHGAYADLATLAGLRFPASTLTLRRPGRALNQLAGPNKSNFRGRGLDFEEARIYQPGDDIRTIDWRVTARTGTTHTKVFSEERERPVIVFTDQRSNLFFGSRHCFKSVLAAHLSALIGWAALHEGERVGSFVFNENEHLEIRPRRSRKNMLLSLSQLLKLNQSLPINTVANPQRFAAMLVQLRRIAPTGSSIYLISDFKSLEESSLQEPLFQLARHHQITAIACSDALEQRLPASGRYTVSNGDKNVTLDTTSNTLRTRFNELNAQHEQTLGEQMRRLGIPLLHCTTNESPLMRLQQFYGRSHA